MESHRNRAVISVVKEKPMTTKINKNQINGLNTWLSEIIEDIAALSGLGGYINSYDFGTATPTQQALTDYTLTQIPNISASEIFNGTKVPYCQSIRKINNANDESTVSFSGIIKVESANSEIDVRVAHDQGGDVNLTTVFCSLNVSYIGDI